MKAEPRAKRTKDLYDTLNYPEVKENYYESPYPEIFSSIEKGRAKAALQRSNQQCSTFKTEADA
jgi:hypothetical protein